MLPLSAGQEKPTTLYLLRMWGLQSEAVQDHLFCRIPSALSAKMTFYFVFIDFVCVHVILYPFD